MGQKFGRVRLESKDQRVARVIFDHPESRNAMEWSAADEFRKLMATLAKSKLEVVVFTGAGDFFSSGGGFAFFDGLLKLGPSARQAKLLRYYESFLSLVKLPQLTVAEVNGDAYGAASGVILACDFRVAKHDAKVALNFSKIGLGQGMGTGLIGEKLFGAARLREWLVFGKNLTGTELKAHGVAWDTAADHGELRRKTDQFVEQLLAVSAVARREIKATTTIPYADLKKQLVREAAAQARAFGAADFQEWFKSVRTR